jgi:hypothetical protein
MGLVALLQEAVVVGEPFQDVLGRLPTRLHAVECQGIAGANDLGRKPHEIGVMSATSLSHREACERVPPIVEGLAQALLDEMFA